MKQARVIEERKTNYLILDRETKEEFLATVRGSFFAEGTFPKVGDYVEYEPVSEDGNAVIESILPRSTAIVRKAVETGGEQVIVANADLMFIVMGLDGDYNLSRLERYLLLARESEVEPVVVLNKMDEVDEVDTYINEVSGVVGDVPVHAVCALSGQNMESLLLHFNGEKTAVLLGSSGAGKSTITNWLLQEDKQAVGGVREDDSHGRHTTTNRQLFSLPTGGYVIDTPGMRELGVIKATEEDEAKVFGVLDVLATECRFSNCDHDKSDGCALKATVLSGEIEERQLKNYLKLQKEREFEEMKQEDDFSWQYRKQQRELHKGYKQIMKGKQSRKYDR